MLVCLCANGQQVELKECRLMLAEERRARLKAESKLMEVSWCVVRVDSTFIRSFNVCILHFTAGEKINFPAEWNHHVLNLKNIR